MYNAHSEKNKKCSITSKPLFSIIIPVYQCEETLDASIQSVLNQDESNYEIILVDDGSTDRSGEICDRYADAFPLKMKVIHKANEGPFLARMDAIESANGTYLMFLDADDAYIEGTLRRIRQELEDICADMVIFNHVRILPDGTQYRYTPQYENETVFEGPSLKQLYLDAVTGENLNALWQKCVKRSLLPNTEELRWYGKMMMGEDKLLVLEMLKHTKKAVYLADGLYQYHISPSSLSHSLSIKHYQDMSVICQVTLQYAESWGLDNCRFQFCKDKVALSLKCLSSVAGQVHENRKDRSEFNLLAQDIMDDPELWRSFDVCKGETTRKVRTIFWLLRRRWISLVYLCFCVRSCMGKRPSIHSAQRHTALGGSNPCDLNG